MKKIRIRSLPVLLTVAALLTVAIATAAQTPSPAARADAQATSPLLNAVEVQRLVARGTPDDHAQLRAHFMALADRSDANAKRHTAMSRGFVGNPSRNLTSGLSAHCTRIAALNADQAAALRELATHHATLAVGRPSTPPPAAARYDAGAGAADPDEATLARLAATASTPADHRALETYFLAQAKRYTSEAAEHAGLARSYRGRPRAEASAVAAARHCDRLEALARDAAKEATAAAAEHRTLSGSTR
jgi:hypothetical protein